LLTKGLSAPCVIRTLFLTPLALAFLAEAVPNPDSRKRG